MRQWVLSFPIPLRLLFATHPELLSPVLQIVHRAISTVLRKQAGLKRGEAHTGACIASDVSGHKELIREGINGRMFRAGSSASLAEAVLDMLEQRERWAALKENGRRYVEEERNWHVSVSKYCKVYHQLLQYLSLMITDNCLDSNG